MPRIVPSKVRESIALLRNNIAAETAEVGRLVPCNRSIVRAIIDLVDQIPPELMRMPPEDYAKFSVALSIARQSLGEQLPGQNAGQAAMLTLGIFDGRPALRVIYDSLGLCPDQAADPLTAGLTFIPDADLREGLRSDISAATSALLSHEYKGATVLAGAVVEALLLWSLEQVGEATVRAAYAKARKGALDTWTLGEYIEAAQACGLIGEATTTQARLAQDFRNLIHPGKAQRIDARCTLGTAYSALAAVDAVAGDFSARGW